MDYTRYAIYFTPAPGPLADFGAAWLGWDIATGTPHAHPDLPDLPLPVEKITRTPRKYGFHATIKPPFRLAPGTQAAALSDALSTLCESVAPVTLDGLRLSQIGRFLALVPEGETDALSALAARVVRDLDPFRAAPTDEELARRRARPLTERQDTMLRDWGYPYVMEEFRFHMTLSGALPPDALEPTFQALSPMVAKVVAHPTRIDRLSLVGEREDGRFETIRDVVLTG